MSTSNCTFRSLFDGRSPASVAVGNFIDTLKAEMATREPGWLRQLCKNDVTTSFVYIRAILAARCMDDKEMEEVLGTAWGASDHVSFHPKDLFLETMEPHPPLATMDHMENNPIQYMEIILADQRKEFGWLRMHLFPTSDKLMKETERRMLRLQVCLLIGMGKSPYTIQRPWGLSKSKFRSIVVDLKETFMSPICRMPDRGSVTPINQIKRNRSNTPVALMTRLFLPSITKDTPIPEMKDVVGSVNTPVACKTPNLSPSPNEEGAFFIEEDLDALDETATMVMEAKTQPSALRKTLVSVLSPLRSTRKLGRDIQMESSDPDRPLVDSSLVGLPIARPSVDTTSIVDAATAIATERADDGESIEIALDGVEEDATNAIPTAHPTKKIIEMDLDCILSPSADDHKAANYQEHIRSQLVAFRESVKNGDKTLYSFEFTLADGKKVSRFIQVVESKDSAEFEQNTNLYGWFDEILRSSVSSHDTNEAAKYVIAMLGKNYTDELAAVAEDFGFMRVMGPEL